MNWDHHHFVTSNCGHVLFRRRWLKFLKQHRYSRQSCHLKTIMRIIKPKSKSLVKFYVDWPHLLSVIRFNKKKTCPVSPCNWFDLYLKGRHIVSVLNFHVNIRFESVIRFGHILHQIAPLINLSIDNKDYNKRLILWMVVLSEVKTEYKFFFKYDWALLHHCLSARRWLILGFDPNILIPDLTKLPLY